MEYPVSNRMSRIRGSAIREIFKYAADPSVISLAGGNPAPELFPNRELAEIAADLLRNQPVLSLQYGITEGYLPLREAVRDRLLRKEGIGGAEDDLIITSGGQQGIELATKILVNEGDTVVVERASHPIADNTLPYQQAMEACERKYISDVVDACGGNIRQAAEKMGLHISTLYRKIDKLGLSFSKDGADGAGFSPQAPNT